MSESKASSARIFVIHGNDEYQIEKASKAFLETRCPHADRDGSLTTIRGDVDTVDQAVEAVKQTLTAVQSLNMFSPENVTWLREVQFLSGAVFKSESVKEVVEKLQETLGNGLGPEQLLLITVSGKLDARSRFLKALKPVAEFQEFMRVTKEWEIKEDAIQKLNADFKKRGMKADSQAIQEIAVRVGNDPRLMQNELEKLDLYVGKQRSVTLQDVELMVPMQQEAQVYMLGDCVGSRNLPKAMEMLQQMETNGLPAVGVMATLHNSLREMAYLGACVHGRDARVEENGRFGKFIFTNPEAQAGFQLLVGDKTRSPFRLFQLGRQAKNFSPRELDRMLRFSAETYDAFFRSSTPPYEQLRQLMLRIFYECMRKSA
ncbi:DNA polymerase III subunit delta [Kiritimatiellota bacterium B12222]|nr:DNA polymerase III subunit delta [Kiritimatiellota bacterium B12222]